MIGRTVADYRIAAAIGAGGMGEVCRATDTKLGRDVALKVLPATADRGFNASRHPARSRRRPDTSSASPRAASS